MGKFKKKLEFVGAVILFIICVAVFLIVNFWKISEITSGDIFSFQTIAITLLIFAIGITVLLSLPNDESDEDGIAGNSADKGISKK